jgi:2-methylisocitrate lyase-like PEP mutase family enzyme
MSAAAFRALHVAGDPVLLPNAWDAATARLVERAGFAAVATTSHGVADALGYADHEQTPPDEMLAAVARIARAVEVPVTADLEAGYGLDDAELADRVLAAGAIGLNLEDSDHANPPALVPAEHHAARIARIKDAGDLVLNARIDVHLRGGETSDALERARRYRDAGADCVYPIGVADEATIAAFCELGFPVNVLLRPGAPPITRLAQLGVARISMGGGLYNEMMRALEERLNTLVRDRSATGLSHD